MSKGVDWVVPLLGSILICGGLMYALGELADTPNRLTTAIAVPASSASTSVAPGAVPSKPFQTPASPTPPADAPRPSPAAPLNVVRTATRSYALPPARSAAEDAVETYRQLQQNCYAAAANNRNGDYPALQQLACQRYSEFASRNGFDPGSLPTYGRLAVPRRPSMTVAAASAAASGECAGLIAEKDGINARMRAGYQEPWGQQMRDRLHDLDIRLWQLHCPRQ